MPLWMRMCAAPLSPSASAPLPFFFCFLVRPKHNWSTKEKYFRHFIVLGFNEYFIVRINAVDMIQSGGAARPPAQRITNVLQIENNLNPIIFITYNSILRRLPWNSVCLWIWSRSISQNLIFNFETEKRNCLCILAETTRTEAGDGDGPFCNIRLAQSMNCTEPNTEKDIPQHM